MNWKTLLIPAFFIFFRTAEILYPKRAEARGYWRIYQNLSHAALWLLIVIFFLENPMLNWGNNMLNRQLNLYYFLSQYININTLFYALFSFLILDYSTYVWHRLTHRIPFLWRFHKVHHSDLSMDASTIFRFHFVGLSLHYTYKITIAALLGIRMSHLASYEVFLAICSLFHHSNINLPENIDRQLRKLIITRALHINHHQMDLKLAHSNFGSILTIWDIIHNTLSKPNANIQEICGLEKFRTKESLSFYRTLFLLPLETEAKIPKKNAATPESK